MCFAKRGWARFDDVLFAPAPQFASEGDSPPLTCIHHHGHHGHLGHQSHHHHHRHHRPGGLAGGMLWCPLASLGVGGLCCRLAARLLAALPSGGVGGFLFWLCGSVPLASLGVGGQHSLHFSLPFPFPLPRSEPSLNFCFPGCALCSPFSPLSLFQKCCL